MSNLAAVDVDASIYMPTRVHVGAGKLAMVGEHLRGLAVRRPLVVSDPGLAATGSFSRLAGLITAAGFDFNAWTDVEPQPTVETIERAAEKYRSLGCDGVVALGGGSAIDAGKGVAILATNPGPIVDYHGFELFSETPAPMIAIPSTAGTGSEVSYAASIRDGARKLTVRHRLLNQPRVAILDPVVLETLPRHPSVVAGMDALTHAIEAFTSREANLVTSAFALQAIELLFGNLHAFVADRTNRTAGEAMLVGSMLAGVAFSFAGTGNAHCLARTLAGEFHMEHGMACAVTLPRVMEFNVAAAPERFARIAEAMRIAAPGAKPVDAAWAAVTAVRQLSAAVGVPANLSKWGVTSADIPHIAAASLEAGYNRWNPRQMSMESFEELLTPLVSG